MSKNPARMTTAEYRALQAGNAPAPKRKGKPKGTPAKPDDGLTSAGCSKGFTVTREEYVAAYPWLYTDPPGEAPPGREGVKRLPQHIERDKQSRQ
jgi:hypothetical protein